MHQRRHVLQALGAATALAGGLPLRALANTTFPAGKPLKIIATYRPGVTNDIMVLTAQSPESGAVEEEIPVSMDGEDLTIAFNARYIIEVLNLLDEVRPNIELKGALNPGMLRSGADFIYVIMPMQV